MVFPLIIDDDEFHNGIKVGKHGFDGMRTFTLRPKLSSSCVSWILLEDIQNEHKIKTNKSEIAVSNEGWGNKEIHFVFEGRIQSNAYNNSSK